MRRAIGIVIFGALFMGSVLQISQAGSPPSGSISLNKTVTKTGTCPGSDPLDVAAGSEVQYCYTVTNNTNVTLGQHTLVDDHIGPIDTGSPFNLAPGGHHTVISSPQTINVSTLNTATWTAMTSSTSFSNTDTAQVYVCGNGIVEPTEQCDTGKECDGVHGGLPCKVQEVTSNCCTTNCTYKASGTCDDDDQVDPSVEAGAPNGGDGNGDGIPDNVQPDVTSLPAANGNGYLTLVTTGACHQNHNVVAVTEESIGNDPDFSYPFGLLRFTLNCTSADITVIYSASSGMTGSVYRKYGPTPPSFNNPAFYSLPNVTFGTMVIDGQTRGTASFHLDDNQIGDGDPTIDLIVDPGGPGVAGAGGKAPVLSPWMLGVVCVALSVIGVLSLRRKGVRQ